ncbi:MAG: ABC transporter permease [Planctomycetota bacterium]|jgi:ribose transport system permease protein|nr:ABC transporter permease [Planctomycetota bacterium]
MKDLRDYDFLKHVKGFASAQSAIVFFIVYLIVAALLVPKFANAENLVNIVVQSSELILLACGMTFVFLNGGIDFSQIAVIALGSVIGAQIMVSGLPPAVGVPLGVLAMLCLGLAVGAVNGLAVTLLKMPSFVATMATQLVFSGAALTITRSKTIPRLPRAFGEIARGSLFGVQYPIIIALAVFAVLAFLLNRTIYGKYITSIGTNHKTAKISGLPVRLTIFSLFLISGLCAAFASIIMTARLRGGVPSLGKDMLMDVVAAVVIGGTSVAGGEGNIHGSLIGAVLVLMLNNSLNLLGVSWYNIMLCKGLLVLIISLLALWQRKRA